MEIYILDKEINILDVFSTYESILWTTRVNEPGTFKAVFVYTNRMNLHLQRGNLLYKTDEDEPAVITRKYLKLNKYGEQTITVQGYMASRYLHQRIIWNKMVMKGTPEQIMRQMVAEQCINPSDSRRKIKLLELGDFHGHNDDVIEKQITYDNLQEALTDVSKKPQLGYRLILDYSRKKLVFDVYKGVDRTLGSANPCIFTRSFGNVYTQEYQEDDSNYYNVCLVGGPGEDKDRIMTTVGEADGLERYEFFYNAAGHSAEGVTTEELIRQLQQKGTEKMAAYYIAKAFESKINKSKAMKFALGDFVTCTDPVWNVAVNTQVKEIQKGFSKTEESFLATFGDNVPTLIDLIKAKE